MELHKLRRRIVASLGRLYPFYSGCGTFANGRFIQTLAGGKSDQLDWATLIGGTQVLVPLNDLVGCALYYVGDLDKKITWVCKRVLRKGDVVIDVGANMGLVTFITSRLVGSSGRIISYEPNPQMAGLIRKSIHQNQITNIELHQVGLGLENDKLKLSVPEENAGKASLVRTYHEDQNVIEVPVENTSIALKKINSETVRLMKIDVEGFEEEVLRGGLDYLRELPPEVILFEINGYNGLLGDYPCIKLLEDLGYCIYGLPKVLLRMRMVILNTGEAYPDINDFVALHKSRNFDELKHQLGV